MTDDLNLRSLGLGCLNSATKYPSILTYHAMGKRGCLTDECTENFDADELVVTEKVDGTNARIIASPGDYIIGSREDFLTAKGDRIHNASMEIVETVQPAAERIAETIPPGAILVFYGEVYGGKVGSNAKQYTGERTSSFLLFDVAVFPLDELPALLGQERSSISSWRQHGGQTFLDEEALRQMAAEVEIPLTPRIYPHSALPLSIAQTSDWLDAHLRGQKTLAAIDDGGRGRAEGLVVRTADRRKIVKLRFEDYRKTMRGKGTP